MAAKIEKISNEVFMYFRPDKSGSREEIDGHEMGLSRKRNEGGGGAKERECMCRYWKAWREME